MKQPHVTDHPIHELLTKRWSPRAFSDRPLDPGTVLTLFEAARWAASAFNEQPWRFIHAAKTDGARFGKIVECLSENNRIWADRAPLLILTLVRMNMSHNGKPNRWAFHDLGLAMGNLTAQAAAQGLSVHSMAGFSVEKARELFSVSPEFEPVTAVAVGYAGDPDVLPEALRLRELAVQERKPLAELLL